MAARAQFTRESHQVVIVHPDDVVLVHQRAQVVRIQLIYAHVPARLGTGVLLEVDPAVENRPEHAIGEPVAIFLNVALRQVDLGIGHFVDW